MPKLTLTDIANISGAESTAIANINANSAAIETALENTLSRDGTSPNQMNADLDMNDNEILNVATPTAATSAVNRQYLEDYFGDADAVVVTPGLNTVDNSHVKNNAGITTDKLSFTHTGSGAVPVTVRNRLSNFAFLEDFGATGNGTTDDYAAIMAAFTQVSTRGGKVYGLSKTYAVGTPIVLSDGTVSARSTKAGLNFEGVTPGVGAGEFGTPNFGTTFKWIGGSTTSPVLEIDGPTHSYQFRNLTVDGNGLADLGIKGLNLYKCVFEDVRVERAEVLGWEMGARDSSLSGLGVTQGFMSNTFRRCSTRDPRTGGSGNTTGNGFKGYGGKNQNIGWSRNTFESCDFIVGGSSGTYGMELEYCDNNTFIDMFTFWAAASTSGVGVKLIDTWDNNWFSHRLLGGVSYTDSGLLASTVPPDCFYGYALGDAEPLPAFNPRLRFILQDGRMIGRFAGSMLDMSGCANPGSGLGTTTQYFSLAGVSSAVASHSNNVIVMSRGANIVSLRVYLNTAPGGSATRALTLFKNGVATSLEVTWNSGESGDKASTPTTPISVNGGDRLELRSSCTGTPATSQASWAIAYYPTEVL